MPAAEGTAPAAGEPTHFEAAHAALVTAPAQTDAATARAASEAYMRDYVASLPPPAPGPPSPVITFPLPAETGVDENTKLYEWWSPTNPSTQEWTRWQPTAFAQIGMDLASLKLVQTVRGMSTSISPHIDVVVTRPVTAYLHHLTSGWGTLDKTGWTLVGSGVFLSAYAGYTGEIYTKSLDTGTHSLKTGVVQYMFDWDESVVYPPPPLAPFPPPPSSPPRAPSRTRCTSSRATGSASTARARAVAAEARRRRGWPSTSPRAASSRRLQQVAAGTADPRFTGRRYMRIEPALTADEDERDQVYEVASTDEAVLISLRPHSERYGSAGRIRLTGRDGGVVTCALERKLEAATAVVTFGNAPVPSHQVCAGQDVVVDFAAGSHNIREYDPATFNIFNPVYLGDAYSPRLSGTHTVSGLGASPGGTRHYICAYHETAKFDTECVHTPDDAPLLECLDVACDNGVAQTLCSGDEMNIGVETGAIALTLTSEFAVPPPPPRLSTARSRTSRSSARTLTARRRATNLAISSDSARMEPLLLLGRRLTTEMGMPRVTHASTTWLTAVGSNVDPTLMLRRQVTCPVTRLPSMRTERSSLSAHRATAGLLDMGGFTNGPVPSGSRWAATSTEGQLGIMRVGLRSLSTAMEPSSPSAPIKTAEPVAWYVRVYEWSGSEWAPMGSDIEGEAPNDCSGFVSLSSDGNVLAIGGPYNDGTGSEAGHVRVFEWSGGSWSPRGSDIDGAGAGDYSGYRLALSGDGAVLAIGSNAAGGTSMCTSGRTTRGLR